MPCCAFSFVRLFLRIERGVDRTCSYLLLNATHAVERKIDKQRMAQHFFFGNRAEIAAVAGVISVVAHGEEPRIGD